MNFDDPALHALLDASDDATLDTLPFGVIGFGADGCVTRYNAAEAQGAGYSPAQVLGRHLFTDVAPCMNNYLVAQRFDDEPGLDQQLEYTFTFRVRPTLVRLRLLKQPGREARFVVVLRSRAA